MTSKLDPTRFADGVPVKKADLREAFTTARAELEHGGYVPGAGPDLPPRRVRDALAERLSVTDFGAVGDGKTDDGPAFQRAIETGREIYVPKARYRIVTPLKIPMDDGAGGRAPGCYLIGEVGGIRGSTETRHPILQYDPVDPDTDEPLLTRGRGWLKWDDRKYTFDRDQANASTAGNVSIRLENLEFRCWSGRKASAVDLHLTSHSLIQGCTFNVKGRGVTLGGQCFSNTLLNNRYFNAGADLDARDGDWWNEYTSNSWALLAGNHTYIFGHDGGGYGRAHVILGGLGNVFHGWRIEACRRAVLVGEQVNYDGLVDWPVDGVSISGFTIERCGIGVEVKRGNTCTVQNGHILCALHSTRYRSRWGAVFSKKIGRGVKIRDTTIKGTTLQGRIKNDSQYQVAENIIGDTGGVYEGGVRHPFGIEVNDQGSLNYHVIDHVVFRNAPQEHRSVTAFHDLMVRGLTGFNLADRGPHGGITFARNLGGTINVGDQASSASVFFEVTGEQSDLSFNKTPEIRDNASSQLAAGKYRYIQTFLGRAGETGAVENAWNVFETTVESGQEVRLAFRKATGPLAGTRVVYRYKETYDPEMSGVTLTYWKLDAVFYLTDEPDPWIDDGTRASEGREEPFFASVSTPTHHEVDANYQIIVQPSWHTTTVVTKKATTGFTIEFGTPAPDGDQTVSWLLFRP